jgi:hypothetical protein
MDRALVAVCLAVLAVTAGCSSPLSGAGAETPSTTVTAADVPDPTADSLAPGLTEVGVLDPDTFASAHASVLENRSYTAVFNRTRYFDGQVVWQRDARAAFEPPGRYRIKTVEDSVYSTVRRESLIAMVGTGRLAVRTGDGETVRKPVTGDPLAAVGVDPLGQARIAELFGLVDVETIVPREPGARLYRLGATEIANRSRLLYGRDRLLAANFSATVDSSGVVRAYTFRYAFVRGRTNVTVVERYRVGKIGATAVNDRIPAVGEGEIVPNGSLRSPF